MEKSKERLNILKKIEEYEKSGRFDEDVEDDPPSREIEPDEVDYLQKKLITRIKSKYAFHQARKYLNKILKNKEMIVDDIIGCENIGNLKTGAIITCNHFNAFDSFAIQMAYEKSVKSKKVKFFRVIREGNYTSFPGFFGFLMRNCNTLPLSSNKKTMQQFMRSVSKLLNDGHLVLVYPEQSMWWNYRKPKPLKKGAFQFAVKANVPVVPCFITMKDSDIIGSDGFNIQRYTIHISKPIMPDSEKNQNENIEAMMNENYRIWKEIYEEVYQTKLEYLTEVKNA